MRTATLCPSGPGPSGGIGDAFTSQFRGRDVEPYDELDVPSTMFGDLGSFDTRADYVLADGRRIGVATGRTCACFERRFVSVAWIETAHAAEGTEVVVLWGNPDRRPKETRATVARFPCDNGEFRNETFDTAAIPSRVPVGA